MSNSSQGSSSNSTRASPSMIPRKSKVIDDDEETAETISSSPTVARNQQLQYGNKNSVPNSKIIHDDDDESSNHNSNSINNNTTTNNNNNHTKKSIKNFKPRNVEFQILYDLSPDIINQVHSKPISTAKISPNSCLLATGSADGTIQIWDIISKVSDKDEENDIGEISGEILARQTPPGVFNPDNNNTKRSTSTSSKNGATADFSSFTEKKNSNIVINTAYKFKVPEPTVKCVGHSRAVNDVCWSPDSQFICSASDDGSVRVWSSETGEILMILTGHNQFAYCVAFSPSGNIIASGSYDETVRLWDVKTGKCLRTLPAHSDPVTSVSFSRDGSLLVTSSYDGFCRIWDTTTGQCLKTILKDPHDAPPLSCGKLSPHGNYLLVSTMSKETEPAIIRLWQVRPSVRNIKNYTGHVNNRFSVNLNFHPRENVILSCSEDGYVYVWDIQTETIVSKLNCNTKNFEHSPHPQPSTDSMDTSETEEVYPVLTLDINALDYMVTCTTEPRLIFWRGISKQNFE